MRFGVVVAETEKAREVSKKIGSFLKERGHEIVREKLSRSDLVITLGGDGTLIHAACEYAALSIPFIGINLGTLGFLTAEEKDGWEEALKKIIAGDFIVSERMTLEAQIELETRNRKPEAIYRAVNEVVVKGMYRVIDLEILVNGQKFMEVSGDGLIVSTQTGSTAYSLSAGGPIVDPELACFVMTPVNAHGLPVPSVILSPDDEVEIKVKEGSDISLIIDGQEHTKVESGQGIKITKG